MSRGTQFAPTPLTEAGTGIDRPPLRADSAEREVNVDVEGTEAV